MAARKIPPPSAHHRMPAWRPFSSRLSCLEFLMRSNAVPSTLVETFHVEESRAGHAWLYEDSHLYIINGVKHAFIRTERDVHQFAVLDNLKITVRLTDAEIASLKDKK